MHEKPEPETPDGDLVERVRAGDRAAFAEIYRRHHQIVFRFARAMSGSVATAEDVVHEVFLVLMSDMARYDASRSPLPLYLYGIARNLVRSALRRQRRLVELPAAAEEVPSAEDPLATLGRARQFAQLRAAVSVLPVRYREAVVLCDLHELRYEEAAGILRVPVGTVRSRLHRARNLLAERLTRSSVCPLDPLPARWRYFS